MAIDPKTQFKEQLQALADKFQSVKNLGSLQSKEAGSKPENYQQMLRDARAQFKADQAALKQQFAAGNPNSRFFGTKRGALRNVPDDFELGLYSKPENFKQLKEQRLIGEERDVRRAPGMKKGGKVSSASKRADGIATKGKTRGRMI